MLIKFLIIFLVPFALVQGNGEFPGSTQPCYFAFQDGTHGECIQDNCCSGNLVSNFCPNYPNGVRCCFGSNSCNSCGTCSDNAARLKACEILALYERNQIWLKHNHFNSAGNNPYDGASALSNMRDTCRGRQVKRSAYGGAPGGCVCLKYSMLAALHEYAVNFYNTYGQAIEVNSIAGSSHSSNSWHYQGNVWDVSCSTPRSHCPALRDFCLSKGPIEACYPGSSCGGHETWVHCAF